MLDSCNGQNWVCVIVKRNCEIKLAKICASKDIPFYCPLLPTKERLDFRRRRKWRPLWQGYVFCRVDQSAKEFLRLLSFVIEIQSIPNEREVLENLREVDALLKEGRLFSSLYSKGDVIEVVDGSLSGLKGVVEKILPEDGRVMVLLKSVSYQGSIIIEASDLKITQHADNLKILQSADEIAFEKIRLAFEPINAELMRYLDSHPEFLHKLNARRFEVLIADLLKDMGYDVQLTPQTRDGGRDILAVFKIPQGEVLTIVDCKRFALDRKIGPDLVQRLLWLSEHYDRASRAMMASTTYYTSGALEIEREYRWKLSLKDFDAVKEWVGSYGKWTTRKNSGLWVPNQEAL